MIKTLNLSKKYRQGSAEIDVLSDVSIDISNPGMFFLLGKSGSGKSTLLNILGGIIGDYSGNVSILETNVGSLNEDEWDAFRGNNIGLVFQDYSLLEEKTVAENLMLPLWISNSSPSDSEKRVCESLKRVGLSGYETKQVNKLSGGEKQRVAIARAIINSPCILLADEPTGNLDSFHANEVFDVLKEISEACIVFVVSHDNDSAYKYGDAVFQIQDGKVFENSSSKKSFWVELQGKSERQVFYDNQRELVKGIESELRNCAWQTKDEMALNIKCVESKCETEKPDKNMAQSKNNRKPLGIRKALAFARDNYRYNKVKKSIGLLLLVVIMVMGLFLWNCSAYDGGHSLWEFYKNNKIESIELLTQCSYTNTFYEECSSEIDSGKHFCELISGIYGEENIYSYIEDSLAMISENHSEPIRIIFLSNEGCRYNLVAGEYPTNRNEIALTDYLCSFMGYNSDDIGRTIVVNQEEFCLSGIVLTDYKDYGIETQIESKRITEYGEYKLVHEYMVAFANDDYLSVLCDKTESLGFDSSSVVYMNQEHQFLRSYMEYGAYSADNNVILEAGRFPTENNEIIISSNVAEAMHLLVTDFSVVEGDFVDIHAEKYNYSYSDRLNMAEFFPDGVRIVGVFTSADYSGMAPDALISANVFNQIKEAYFSVYYKAGYYIISDDMSESKMDEMLKYNLVWQSPNALRIHSFINVIDSIAKYVFVMLIVLCVGLMAICSLLVGQSIKGQARMLGVMRAIGYRRSDLGRIFYSEALGIGIVGALGSIIITCILSGWINYDYSAQFLEYKFNILTFSFINILIPALVCIFLCVLSGIKPIRRLSARKPFELLHESVDSL